MKAKTSVAPASRIASRILELRGQRVLLDRDLAELYGVSTKRLNEQVRRNRERFPADFLLELTWDEMEVLRSQYATLETAPSGRGRHRKYPSMAFTEQGVAMLSSVLRSKRAIQVNIEIMRTFVRLRSLVANHAELARRLDALEQKYDGQFDLIFDAIRALMTAEARPARRIGFVEGLGRS